MLLRRAAWVCLFLGSVSCASKPAPAPLSVEPAATKPDAEAAPDLSPVAAPRELVGVGRVKRPREFVETLASWTGLPIALRMLLPSHLREAEALVDWNAPLEAAAVLDQSSTSKTARPLFVVSLGLTGLDSARSFVESQGGHPTRVAPGVYRVEIQRASCAIAASLGPSPARLVCGDDWKDVEALLPYATRGLPNERLTERDLLLELRLRPVEKRYHDEIRSLRILSGLLLRQIGADDARLDRALSEIVYALADELMLVADEADRLTLGATLDKQARVLDIDYGLSLEGNASTIGQMLRETSKRAAPAPALFFRLPAEAYSGAYGVPGDKERLSKIVPPLAELVDAFFAHAKLGAKFRERVKSATLSLPELYGLSAYASGATPAKKDAPPAERFAAQLGWHVGAVEVRIDLLTKLFGELTLALNDKELGKWLAEKHQLDKGLFPKAKSAPARVPTFAAAGTAYTVELPPKLAQKLLDLEQDASAAPAQGKPKPIPLLLVLAPDGNTTWFAIAGSQKAAIEKLVQAHSEGAATLATRPGLEALKTTPSVSGGFTSVQSLSHLLAEAAKKANVDLEEALNRVPQHGRTPILWWGILPEAGKSPSLGGKLRVPAAAFADAGALIPQLKGL